MTKTWKNGKKARFWPDFDPFPTNLGPKNFLKDFNTTRC